MYLIYNLSSKLFSVSLFNYSIIIRIISFNYINSRLISYKLIDFSYKRIRYLASYYNNNVLIKL